MYKIFNVRCFKKTHGINFCNFRRLFVIYNNTIVGCLGFTCMYIIVLILSKSSELDNFFVSSNKQLSIVCNDTYILKTQEKYQNLKNVKTLFWGGTRIFFLGREYGQIN